MSAEDFDKTTQASPQLDEPMDESNERHEPAEDSLVAEEADPQPESDETTGASPGTAQACTDLGLNSLAANLKRFNIKPPGVA